MARQYSERNISGFTRRSFSEGGQAALLTVVLILLAILILIGTASNIALQGAKISELDYKSKRSYFLAESGMEDAVYRILRGKNLPSSYALSLYGADTVVSVSDVFGGKDITSAADLINAHRAVKSSLRQGVGASFNYGVQVGYLGLYMENQSKVIGSVYSNGSITGKNSPQITGDAWVAGGTAASPNQEQSLQTSELLLRDISARRDGAQGFIPSITADIRKISLFIKKVGNPGDIDIRILPDNGGIPKSSGSEAGGTIKAQNVTVSYSWVEATLNSNDPLLQGQKYWLVLDNGSDDPAKYYVLGASSDTSYPNGTFLYSPKWDANSPVWTASSKDSAFKIFMGIDNTILEEMAVGGNAHAHTIKDAAITGDAYFQIIQNSTAGGIQFPGVLDPPPQNMPLSEGQIAEFKAAGDAGSLVSGNYLLDNKEIASLGPAKITGNMTVENQAELTVDGTIHVLGNLRLQNTCLIKLNSSFGPSSGIIIVDGTVTVENQCDILGSGDPASYMMIISTSPSLGGPSAMHIKNSVSGAIFYASEGEIFLENQIDLKEAVGQKMRLKNQATVTYETGLANVNFSSGPSGGWTIDSWKEITP